MPRWYLNLITITVFMNIFTGNQFFTAVIGKQQLTELATLRNQLLGISSFKQAFNGQNLFISFHPSKSDAIDLY